MSKNKSDVIFENLVKEIMEKQGYLKQEDTKELITTILENIEPIIAKHVKNHFYEIGNFIINNINNKPNIVEKQNVENS
jgi:nucleoid DNA-binding protein